MCWLPARHAGQVPSQESGITVTGSPTAHPVDAVAQGGDLAAHLMTEDQRPGDARIHRTVDDVQVGAAQAGVGHPDLHLTGARRGLGDLGGFHGSIAEVTGSAHAGLLNTRCLAPY